MQLWDHSASYFQMPRYFFHIRSPQGDHQDSFGEVYPDDASAKNEGRLIASDILREAALTNCPAEETLEVTDERGRLVLRFKYAEET
jgi:hypothetical protein